MALLAKRRFAVQASTDAFAWAASLVVASWLRYEFTLRWVSLVFLAAGIGVAITVQMFVGRALGLYANRFRYGSIDEAGPLVASVAVTGTVTAIVNWLVFQVGIPRTAPVIATFVCLCMMVAARYGWRLVLARSIRPSEEHATRALVIGAGEGGLHVITAMLNNPDSPFVPVALLDDNPDLQNLRIRGVRVMGTRNHLAQIAAQTEAETVVVAIPSASADFLREVSAEAAEAGLGVLALPPVRELFGPIGVSDIRPLSELDLLGRREITTDLPAVAGYLTGKRVLVTGAGGSIGSELCRQITKFAPAQLVMLDRDDTALHNLQMSLEGRALLDDPNLVVACIRDKDRLEQVFEDFAPQVVFHAAALKHLSLLELHPAEGVKTNVVGTWNLLDASIRHGVERFVNISTDKAADPTSVLGRTKQIAERLTAAAGRRGSGTYLSVRFGNVLGSRGSVLPLFRKQIEAGGPITVTHPEVTRYFMTVQEACQLVVNAGAIGSDGEALVLDMGTPVRIADVARQLAAQADRDIEIVFTGLRPGEKLHEVLFSTDEGDSRPFHPLISHVTVDPVELSDLEAPDLEGFGPTELTGRHRIDLRLSGTPR